MSLKKYVIIGALLTSAFQITYAKQQSHNIQEEILENDINNNINELYQDGVIVPNQPLDLSDAEREQIRNLVEKLIREQITAVGMRLKSFEREQLNALLFNYGIQVLEDNRVVALEVYIPKDKTTKMLTPNYAMPDNAVTLTKDNVNKIAEDIHNKKVQKENKNQELRELHDRNKEKFDFDFDSLEKEINGY